MFYTPKTDKLIYSDTGLKYNVINNLFLRNITFITRNLTKYATVHVRYSESHIISLKNNLKLIFDQVNYTRYLLAWILLRYDGNTIKWFKTQICSIQLLSNVMN